MYFIGVDPGKNGAIAMLEETELVAVKTFAKWARFDYIEQFWTLNQGMTSVMMGAACACDQVRCVLEKVHSTPQMGVVSAFTFGASYERAAMAMEACGWLYDEVSPQRWQKYMNCLTGGDKKVTKAKAVERFPAPCVKITLANADAILLAEYARRTYYESISDR